MDQRHLGKHVNVLCMRRLHRYDTLGKTAKIEEPRVMVGQMMCLGLILRMLFRWEGGGVDACVL